MSSDDKPLPQGIGLTPLDEAYRQDPYPIYKEMRERAPVHRDREMGRVQRHGYGCSGCITVVLDR